MYNKRRMACKTIVGFLAVMVFLFSCNPEKRKAQKNLTVVFYNVENLFDLKDEPNKQDEEFTPDGTKKWDQHRYQKKLEDLSKVLSSINEEELPEIIGLCEVENKQVVEDLVKTGALSVGNYEVVHFESPDFRGIDNALAYRPDEFKILDSVPINVTFQNEPDYVTRDILYVKGQTLNKEVFHIFVNHWSSRIGGTEKSEPNRIYVASLVKNKVDSIYSAEKNPNIIIMGDMNDEPINNSLFNTIGAKDITEEPNARLINLMFDVDKQDLGSYNYRGNWNMLDNIVVSQNLLDDKGFGCFEKQGFVFQQQWMEFKNQEGEISPNRTYGGPNYYGGVSDHFPVYIKLKR